MTRSTGTLGTALVASYAALQVLGRTAGSTRAERAAVLPGDELVARPQILTDHAITIDASAEQIWPWLTQTGWHRGGWYTPGWVDRLLFPGNWPSADRLDPSLVRDLQIGDRIPDGPPGTAEFVVAQAHAPRALVLRSTTHLPPGWDEKYGARMVWTWCFSLEPQTGSSTRVHLRVRGRAAPWWLAAAYVATIVPADYVMAMGMLRGLKRRVECTPHQGRSGTGTRSPARRSPTRTA